MAKHFIILLFLSLIFLLSGCTTLLSAENVFENDLNNTEQEDQQISSSVTLEEAITNTQSDLVENFWFRAHIANNIDNRKNTHMTLDGIMIKPYGYYMRNSLLAEPYEYYRWEDQAYMRHTGNWFRGHEPSLPFDTSYGYDYWKPVLNKANIIATDTVLSIPTTVHEINLTGAEFAQLDRPFLEAQEGSNSSNIAAVLDLTKIRVLFYVGDVAQSTEDREILPIIYKYQTFIQMPIPGAGYMNQEVQHFIFRVNDDRSYLPDVEEIEKFLIEIADIDDEDFEDDVDFEEGDIKDDDLKEGDFKDDDFDELN